MFCYSTVPGNESLDILHNPGNLTALKAKAQESKYAKFRTRAKRKMSSLDNFFANYPALKPAGLAMGNYKVVTSNEIDMSDDDPEDPFRPNAPKITCPLCRAEVPEFLIINGAVLLNGRKLPGICHVCMSRKNEWELAAAQQDKSDEQVQKTESSLREPKESPRA